MEGEVRNEFEAAEYHDLIGGGSIERAIEVIQARADERKVLVFMVANGVPCIAAPGGSVDWLKRNWRRSYHRRQPWLVRSDKEPLKASPMNMWLRDRLYNLAAWLTKCAHSLRRPYEF